VTFHQRQYVPLVSDNNVTEAFGIAPQDTTRRRPIRTVAYLLDLQGGLRTAACGRPRPMVRPFAPAARAVLSASTQPPYGHVPVADYFGRERPQRGAGRRPA
jgi:hypothetical protein